ncbi:MAG: carbon-nitrogen hydrolase family protein [Hyphomonadaceae bacterium]
MTTLKTACIQMRSGVEIQTNIEAATALISAAADQGAQLIATPEMTSLLDMRPGQARPKIVSEAEDLALAAFRALAKARKVWLLIGSLAVTLDTDERLANRSFLLSPTGDIHARYDKIHMFDVEVGDGQNYRESKSYAPGASAVLANTPIGKIGMTICYDVRFGGLYRTLAQAGAELISCPAAFTRVTGKAHWHTLVRARAIETGAYVFAPAQTGQHEDGRTTFGHSLIVSPWGEILAEAPEDAPGIITAELDLAEVAKARARIPSLNAGRSEYLLDILG